MFSKSSLTYFLILAIFGLSLALTLNLGENLFMRQAQERNSAHDGTKNPVSHQRPLNETLRNINDDLAKNLRGSLGLLLLQALVIIVFAKVCATIVGQVRQPKVIGEIIAGVLLGPSALGLFWPQLNHFLFPPESLKNIQFLSQIGLILFMFIVGMEVDLNFLKKRVKAAILVSHVSVVFPYLLGAILALFLFPSFAPAHVGFTAFCLFMGIAMSITAFPVLARILQERQLNRTALGAMAIACAAVDDITAWCILAVVVGIVRAGTIYTAMPVILLSVAYIAAMIWLLRPALNHWLQSNPKENIGTNFMTLAFIVLFASALLSEIIGIHALFGAFLAGVVMPTQPQLRHTMINRLEHLSAIVLLPLFFAFTGLRTQIGLLDDLTAWLICALIILVAVAGKFGGSALAARSAGMKWRNAAALGALMNTRGLMELVVLNIGYDLGILTGKMFTMLVIMALVTTAMTGPSLDLLIKTSRKKRARA